VRFIIALCTKPPAPFVGDAGRSVGSEAGSLTAALKRCESRGDNTGFPSRALKPEVEVTFENLLLNAELPRNEPALVGDSERSLSGGGLIAGSASPDVPCDNPCSLNLPAADPGTDTSSS